MSKSMTRVRWEIDVDGDTPEEIAFNALKIMRSPDSTAIVFEVRPERTRKIEVDLEEYAVCDSCGALTKVTNENYLTEIGDLFSRIEPGGMVPSCECSKCGALAYPASKMADNQ